MIRVVTAVAAAALLVSACTPDGKTVLMGQCVKDGEEKKTCECVVNAMAKHMDKDVFKVQVLEAQGKNAEAEKLAESISPERQMKSMEAMGPMMACAIGGAS